MKTEKCKSCGAPVLWLKHHQTMKLNPIDAAPDRNGNLAISREKGLYRIATGNEIEIAKHEGKNLYISHFATCQDADLHRNK